jgi:hypothetical protein
MWGISALTFGTIRRGLWRFGELFVVIQILDGSGLTTGLYASLTDHLAPAALITVTFSALYDLFDMIARPDLTVVSEQSCNEVQPMLSFGDKK